MLYKLESDPGKTLFAVGTAALIESAQGHNSNRGGGQGSMTSYRADEGGYIAIVPRHSFAAIK